MRISDWSSDVCSSDLYTAHPADKGGPTRWGITQAVARAHGYCGDMRHFPRDEAKTIYRHIYWEQPGFAAVAEIAPDIAAELFDTCVNMCPQVPFGFLLLALHAFHLAPPAYPPLFFLLPFRNLIIK